jgi:hypothetical protein
MDRTFAGGIGFAVEGGVRVGGRARGRALTIVTLAVPLLQSFR